MRIILSILFLIITANTFGQSSVELPEEFQHSIILNNGKKIQAPILNINQFEIQYRGKNDKIMSISADKIFSYHKESTPQPTILYKEDIEIGNDLSQVQMKKFVMGSMDARNNYKGYPLFITGAVLSYSAVVVDTYLFRSEADKMNESSDFPGNDHKPGPFLSEPSIFPVFVPLVFSLGSAVPKTRLKEKHIHFSKYREDTYYQMGFEKMARQKRIMHSLTGSISGLLLGYATYFIVNSLR